MVDVSGIPNMGFGGGGYFGGIPNQQPAMSAAQINAGMWGNYSPQQAQATQNNIYGAGGFGAQPAYYAGLGAAYGRQVAPSSPAAVAAAHPDAWSAGAPAYNSYGGSADQAWYLGGSQGPRPSSQSGGIGSDAARAPDQPAIQSNIPWGGYNAPRQYGWMPNEGAPAPTAPQVYNRGEFNPQTYGWDHNEGANSFGGSADQAWYLGGSQGPRPSDSFTKGAPSSGIVGGWYDPYGGGGGYPQQAPAGRAPAPAMSQDWNSTFNNTVSGNNSAAYPLGGSPWYPGGGRDDPRDVQWMLGGSQGPRPSSLGPSSSLVGNAWATGTPAGTRSAVPDARTYMPSGQFGGYLDHYLWGANSGSLGARGIMADPFGGYVPQGGANDPWNPYAAMLAQQGGGDPGARQPQGYGSAADMLRAGRGWTIAQQPQAVSQEMLGNRINQSMYDLGNAGDYYSRSIGGGFGMNMPSQSQGLTAQDMAAPHAYPPGFRWDQQ